MKTFAKVLLLLVLTAYLIFAFIRINTWSRSMLCRGLNVVIMDSAHAGFITSQEVVSLLEKKHLYPVGKVIDSVNGITICNVLKKNSFIKDAVCYKTQDKCVNILIKQRLPLLRVIDENGKDYYLDEKGYEMQSQGYVADLIVATGEIDKEYIDKTLIPLGKYLALNSFWNEQIEQINVTKEHKIELIPRIGNQLILLGSSDSLTQKLDNLRAFYDKVMPQVGWNKYSVINLSYPNQIICKKRETKG